MQKFINIFYKDGTQNFEAILIKETENYFEILPRNQAEIYLASKERIEKYEIL